MITSLLLAEGLAQLGCGIGAGIAVIGAGLGIGRRCYCSPARGFW